MTPAHFLAVVQAEIRKLFSRASARFGVLLAVLLGLGVPVALGGVRWLISQSLEDPSDMTPMDPTSVLYATLYVRNFFLMRIILIMVGALTLAGEYQTRTLREDVLRPVHRSALLFAKWLALVVFIFSTIVLSLAPCALLSLIAWGTEGEWRQVMLAWLATLACDAGFAALVLAVAAVVRNVPGTMVGLFLFYFANVAVGLGLRAIAAVPEAWLSLPEWVRPALRSAGPYLPSAAFDAWQGSGPLGEILFSGFGALAVYSALSYLVADRVFARIDVP